MDRILILVVLGCALLFFAVREGSRMTKSRVYEIIIAVYTLSCCFARLYLPYVNAGSEESLGGSFGPVGGIWPFYIMSFLLLWIIAVEKIMAHQTSQADLDGDISHLCCLHVGEPV